MSEVMPASFLKISPQEWRSIVAVATSMCEASETPYPQRLYAVECILKQSGIMHAFQETADQKKHREALKKEQKFDWKHMSEPATSGTPLNGWAGEKRMRRLEARN